MSHNIEQYIRALALAGLVLLLSGGLIATVSPVPVPSQPLDTSYGKHKQAINVPFGEIQARSVLVVDVESGDVLVSQDTDTPYPLASLAKIVVGLVALDQYDYDDEITISYSAIKQIGDNGLRVGETWSVRDLVQFMLITSSNDAAYALAEGLAVPYEHPTQNFVRMMNRYVGVRGFNTMFFLNPTGLDDVYGVTGYGTAEDVYAIMRIGLNAYPDIFSATALAEKNFKTNDGRVHVAENTNIAINDLPELIFSKTGYTDNVGGNLSLMMQDGDGSSVAVIILGSTFAGRFSDAITIADSL